MDIALRQIIDETLRFRLVDRGVSRSASVRQTDWLMQPAYVVAYMPKGRLEIDYRDTGMTYSADNGEAIVSLGGKIRKNRWVPVNGEVVIYWCHVRYEIMRHFNLLELFRFPKVFRGRTAGKIGRIVRGLVKLPINKPNDSIHNLIAQKALGLQLLAILASKCEFREDAPTLLDRYRRQADTVGYIENHLREKISVADLARQSHLSISRFHRVFKNGTGRSPTDFIMQKRVQTAQLLLATTSMSVKEIADNTGFTNPFYFCRVFKHYTGATPSVYRSALSGSVII